MSDDRGVRGGADRFGEADRYRDWDAAYVLGSLSSTERLEYEEHLAQCPRCSAAVAELAGLPGLLASLTPDEAFALDGAAPAQAEGGERVGVGATGPSAVAARVDSGVTSAAAGVADGVDAPPGILPTLLSRARTSRRRSRLIAFGVGAGSLAAAAALALIVTLAVTPVAPAGPSAGTAQPGDASLASALQFVPAVPSPLSAVGTLNDEPWGTRIDWTCSYAYPPSGSAAVGGSAAEYTLVVTDRAGVSVPVATWTSAPGTVAAPSATTSIRRADIASVDIVASASGQVLLRSTP
jgi:hypothetical protein